MLLQISPSCAPCTLVHLIVFYSLFSLLNFFHSLCFCRPFLPTRDMHRNNQHPFPCLNCHPHSYIRMVQHLIERCLLLHMDRDQCIKALAEHAKIRPLITLTVWRGLLKENRDFFETYSRAITPRPSISGYLGNSSRFGGRT